MPMLKKKEFHKIKCSGGFKDNEEVFLCPMTNEIFREYDEFCARVILCNSMVWTCSLTGKTGLTYSEAIESEKHAKEVLKDFPTDLRIPVLLLASKTQRTSFNDMVEDVHGYVKDRYFVGETVESSFTGSTWHESHILQVVPPTAEKIQNSKKNGQSRDQHYGPPAILYHYEVEKLNSEDQDLTEVMIVSYDHIRRKKKLSREKLKLFLKQYIQQNELCVFIIKPSVLDKHGIHKIRFDQIFEGSLPSFDVSKRLVRNGKNTKQTSLMAFLKSKSDSGSNKKGLSESTTNLLEKMRKRQEEFKQKREDLKQKKAEDRLKQKEENIKISLMLKKWYKPKNDLELEDHKILPVPAPVCTKIPDEYMGDVLTILEFVKKFSKFLSVKNFFPAGLTLELVERAFVQRDVAGPLMDLIQMFLSTIFNAQFEESSQYNTKLDSSSGIKGRDYNDNISLTEASHFATSASNWSTTCQGIGLINLPLYSLTTSEILRLHLLSSGARINDVGARWRYSYRGGYTSEDDPGLYLRLQHPHIIKALSLHNVTELPTRDILKIIDCLMAQLLTYADIRDFVEDELEKAKQAKFDYKVLQAVERKEEQEYIAAKFKVRKEAKQNNVDPAEQLNKLTIDVDNRKAANDRKFHNLMKLSNKWQIHLGQDRAFRKYIKLESVPGVFVNFQEDNPGYCYEECIQQNPDLVNADRSAILAHLHKVLEETNTSDKENTISTKTHAGDSTTTVSNDCTKIHSNDINGEINTNKPIIDPDKLLICNSNPETCIIHPSDIKRKKWFFFHNTDQITDLVNSLNQRGIQESELKQAIVNDQDRLSSLVENTPITILNSEIVTTDENQEDGEHKLRTGKVKAKPKYEDANLGYPSELDTALILQYALTENILEMEEKIFAGNLGSIKIKNRGAWRQHLANHHFQLLDKTLEKDTHKHSSNKSNEEGRQSKAGTPDSTPENLDPGKFLGLSSEKEPTSESSTNGTDSLLSQTEEDKMAIHSLAYALAQVAEGVDKRYLRIPLGTVRMRSNNNKMASDVFNKWENSLLSSTSYCQIFLHYSSLDNCILWSRSALSARCKVCRKQRDSENMLLCDNCNKGQHLYCHKPKLRSVPKGNWFCSECLKQKEENENINKPSPKKRRRIFVEEEDEIQLDETSNKNSVEKHNVKSRKRLKLQTDDDGSSEQSEINITHRNSITRRSRQKTIPIVEEDSELSDAVVDIKLENNTEPETNSSEPIDDGIYSEHSDIEDNDEQTDEDEEEDEESEHDETTQNEAEHDETAESDAEDAGSEAENYVVPTSEGENGEAQECASENGEIEESEAEYETEENAVENCDMSENEADISEAKQNGINGLTNRIKLRPVNSMGNGTVNKNKEVNGDILVEVCDKCGFGGTLLCCDNCPELYHLECANPPLRRVPRGEWFCHKCKTSKKKEEPDNPRRSILRDDLPLNNAQLQQVLTEVMRQEFAWPFLRPVNKHEVPDYYEIVANPMDFGTIKYKLNMGRYRFDADLMSDVALVFENCKLYNNTTDEVYQCGLKMLHHFVDKSKEVGLHVPHALVSKQVLIEEEDNNMQSEVEEMQVE